MSIGSQDLREFGGGTLVKIGSDLRILGSFSLSFPGCTLRFIVEERQWLVHTPRGSGCGVDRTYVEKTVPCDCRSS